MKQQSIISMGYRSRDNVTVSGRKSKNCLRKWTMVMSVTFLMGSFIYAQPFTQGNDTLKVKPGKEQKSETATREQNQEKSPYANNPENGAANKQQGEKNKKTAVKQVKGARPDMSKAKGARPQSIERPAGTRIPKGAGRPAGAGRPPGR